MGKKKCKQRCVKLCLKCAIKIFSVHNHNPQIIINKDHQKKAHPANCLEFRYRQISEKRISLRDCFERVEIHVSFLYSK